MPNLRKTRITIMPFAQMTASQLYVITLEVQALITKTKISKAHMLSGAFKPASCKPLRNTRFSAPHRQRRAPLSS